MPDVPAGFIPDAPSAAAPAGFVPDAQPSYPWRRPDFSASNATDDKGQPLVNGVPNDLPWYSDPTSAAYRKLADSLVEHLPIIAGAIGGGVGAVGGPAGAITGAAVGGAAGEAYKQLIRAARGQPGPTTATDAAMKMGTQAVVQGATQATGEGIGAGMSALGERLMQSAVKPGVKYLVKAVKAGDDVPRVVQTLLDEGVNVTPGGVAKLRSLLDATNDQIDEAIAQSPAVVAPLKVASRLNDTARMFAAQVNPQADLDAISQVGQNFLEHPSITGTTIPVANAQALKQGTYARIGGKYGQAGAATIEAEKALARGLKEEVANEVPAVSALNARDGRLLEALDVVGKRVALAGNRDPIGFAWVAHNPTTFLAALIDRSPAVKSMLARGFYNEAGKMTKVAPALIRAGMWALTSENPEAADSSSGPASPAGAR